MSLIPMIFSDWWEDLDQPHHLLDQYFGLGLHPEQLSTPSSLQLYVPSRRDLRSRYPALWRRSRGDLLRKDEGGFSTIKPDKDKFQVNLDVQQFSPDEINVKVVDKCVVVEANHEEKKDEHGWISRQFVRRYMIPDQCNIEEVSSRLSSDGVLTITVPRKELPKPEGERAIKIQHTGKPALQKESQENEVKADSDKVQ